METKEIAEDGRFVILLLIVVAWLLSLVLRKQPERRIALPASE